MSSHTNTPLLISPAELSRLDPSNVAILDTSWFMPTWARDIKQEFAAKRVPSSQFWDLDEVATEHELGLSHMMPSGEIFAKACEKFGITPSSRVVFYDRIGVFASPRALLMFRAFGHENSSVLDGGLPRYEAEGYSVETTPTPRSCRATTYPVPDLPKHVVTGYDDIVANSEYHPMNEETARMVLDARPAGRFLGTMPEPRPGIPSGHIPNSVSLPFTSFLKTHPIPSSEETYTTMLPASEIRSALYEAVGQKEGERILQGKRKVIASCGSGMTAAVVWLGLKMLNVEHVPLFDEAWTGYVLRGQPK